MVFLLLILALVHQLHAADKYNCSSPIGTYDLISSCITKETIKISGALTVVGSTSTNSPLHSISGANQHQIFQVQADDTLTLSHLELKQGKGNQGGAISVQFNVLRKIIKYKMNVNVCM